MPSRPQFFVGVLALALALSGCGSDFEPFNLVNSLRVMGIQAEPPDISPGGETTLSALVYAPDNAPIDYQWSWCPLTESRTTGYRCAVDAGDLEGAWSFDLGNAPTADFAYPASPEVLRGLCDVILQGGAPPLAALPDCRESFRVVVRLDVRAAGETVSAIKRLLLYFDAAAANNANPNLGEVEAARDGRTLPLSAIAAAELAKGASYALRVDVPQNTAQIFEPAPTEVDPDPKPVRERLVLTWLVTAGETEFTRTTFIDGQISFENLLDNTWDLPPPELAESDDATLFLVLRDQRGGVAWTTRDVQLGD